jgi:hypothetical protein
MIFLGLNGVFAPIHGLESSCTYSQSDILAIGGSSICVSSQRMGTYLVKKLRDNIFTKSGRQYFHEERISI